MNLGAGRPWIEVDGELRTDLGESATTAEVTTRLQTERDLLKVEFPTLRFSPVALEPIVRMSGTFPVDIVLEYGIKKNGIFHAVGATRDNVILGVTWHPINVGSRALLLDELSSVPCDIGSIDAESSVKLSAALAGSARFSDEVERSEAIIWAASGSKDAVPDQLNAELYPYQIVGLQALRKLAEHNVGALLADQMGLGKTLQAIALMTALEPSKQVLVVVPASLVENWIRELAQFAPTLKVLAHFGSKRVGLAAHFEGINVILTTYETVIADINLLSDVAWDLVVLDEAQKIRNPSSQRAIATKMLPRRLGVAVTGTPVENSLRDLWSLSEFVLPSLLGGLTAFEQQFPDEVEAAMRLGKIVAPLTIRRHVAEVAGDLPEKVEILKSFTLPDSERSIYMEIESKGSAFGTNTECRVACAHASKSVLVGSSAFASMPKVEHLSDLLAEIFARGESALIFGSFSLSLIRLKDYFGTIFPRNHFAILDGGVAAGERQLAVDTFTQNRRRGVLLLNPQVGGVGLNITAANHVVHFNPEYNPAVTEQATARAYRRKQELPVFVHHLYYSNTVEESAVAIADVKRAVAQGVDHGVRE